MSALTNGVLSDSFVKKLFCGCHVGLRARTQDCQKLEASALGQINSVMF